jgi:hypothetical protein
MEMIRRVLTRLNKVTCPDVSDHWSFQCAGTGTIDFVGDPMEEEWLQAHVIRKLPLRRHHVLIG